MLVLVGGLFGLALVSVVWLKAAGREARGGAGHFPVVDGAEGLWVKLAPPEGTELSARDAPELSR